MLSGLQLEEWMSRYPGLERTIFGNDNMYFAAQRLGHEVDREEAIRHYYCFGPPVFNVVELVEQVQVGVITEESEQREAA